MGTEAQRAKLYSVVAGHWGEDAAEAMMAVLSPWDHDEVARKVDVENCRAELRGEIAELRGEIAELRGEIGQVSGRITALSGKVEGQFGRMIAVNAGMMFGFAGIVLTAAKLV